MAVEGYTLPNGFILKELCIMFPGGEYNNFLFQPPNNKILTPVDQRTIHYTTARLNNLVYEDGDIPYDIIDKILMKYKDCRIFTFSDVSLKFLQNVLPSTRITNIQVYGFVMPTILPYPGCCRIHNPRYCALAKSAEIRNFIKWFS